MNFDWAGATATVSVATTWGRSSPTRSFSDVHEPLTELIETVRAEGDTSDGNVNEKVNARVNSARDDGFTCRSTKLLTQP